MTDSNKPSDDISADDLLLGVKRTQAVCQVGCEIPGLNLGTAFETGRLESCRGG